MYHQEVPDGLLVGSRAGTGSTSNRRLLFLNLGLLVKSGMSVTNNIGAGQRVRATLNHIGGIALDGVHLAALNLLDDTSMLLCVGLAEENLVADLGVLIKPSGTTIAVRRPFASCTIQSSLTFQILALGLILSAQLPEAPVDEHIAPSVSVLSRLIITGRMQVTGILCPVAVASVGSRIVQLRVGFLFLVAKFATSNFQKFRCCICHSFPP